ncbi:helix-turn-helix domain-containing protein [Stappia sp. BW2]|uniref:AraC-like ligand-binding domain-containing protein n=1 Tax=Stappia sp. BW2 TaxID=2592622 RepID=UPI0013969F72|nr:helix-turn-helix domain-containing protein [Stappia sp. BW2]
MDAETWSTQSLRGPVQFEAWRHALSRTHLDWDLKSSETSDFHAEICERILDGIRVVECCCDPCEGSRRKPELCHSDEAYFGVLFELSGHEIIRQGDRQAELSAGDFVLWDSEREMDFKVTSRLHKLTLLIPKFRAKRLDWNIERFAGTVVKNSSAVSGISAEALRRLARDFTTIEEKEAEAVMQPILSLLMATLTTRQEPPPASLAHRDHFAAFCRFIRNNLEDGRLDPTMVAEAHGVSLRYLHTVFAHNNDTCCNFMRRERLRRCHADLSRPHCRDTITEIAFRWGFNDAAHFSRAFRAEFGIAPKTLRKK